jgi:hypothetical protein
MTIEAFGQTADGKTVHRVTINGGGLTAKIMTWGATLQDLRLEGHAAPLTLGFPDFENYPIRPISARPPAGMPTGSPVDGLCWTVAAISSNATRVASTICMAAAQG